MSQRRAIRKRNRTDDIPGLTVVMTVPFVGYAAAVVTVWLVVQGIFSPLIAGLLGLVAWIGLSASLRPLYTNLLEGPISRPGCFLGLIFYGIGVVISAILIWRMWPNWDTVALGSVVVVPLIGFGAAFLQSHFEAPRRRRR
jgi:hypothetical protein